MLDQILDTVRKYNMINPGDEIAVGLSGGADSVCLLLSLNELKEKLGISLSALHVNHCLRGDESDRDEEFCRNLCENLGIRFVCGKFRVAEEAERMKLSTELAAREIRYRFFAEHTSGKKLATAHNANDNAETVIFNLTRGTGTRGIAGIPPVRDNIIRPLIEVTRSSIEEYLSVKGQNFVTDSTNLTDDYTRNTIRHNVIPVLEGINSAFFRTVSADSENFRTDNSFIEEEASKAYISLSTGVSSLRGLSGLHPAVRRRCISKLLSESHVEVNSRRIADVEKIVLCGGKINLRGDVYAVAEDDLLSIKTINRSEDEPVCFPLAYGNNIFRNKTVCAELRPYEPGMSGTVIDADRVSGTLFIRSRMPGDRIRLAGNSFTSSVKKLLNSRTEASERSSLCFISDDSGPVFIEGIGISDYVRVTENTKNVLIINILCE